MWVEMIYLSNDYAVHSQKKKKKFLSYKYLLKIERYGTEHNPPYVIYNICFSTSFLLPSQIFTQYLVHYVAKQWRVNDWSMGVDQTVGQGIKRSLINARCGNNGRATVRSILYRENWSVFQGEFSWQLTPYWL